MVEQSPIRFEERPGGRLVALLGVWEVGDVTPFPHGDRCKAHWRVAPMHDAAASEKRLFPARDVEEAKRRLEDYLLEWIEGSGLAFKPREQIRAVRAAAGGRL
jgi:hypothetical protein